MFSIHTNKSLIILLEKKKKSCLADLGVRRGVRSGVLELLMVVGAFLARLRESHIFKALITKAVVRELVVEGLAHKEACQLGGLSPGLVKDADMNVLLGVTMAMAMMTQTNMDYFKLHIVVGARDDLGGERDRPEIDGVLGRCCAHIAAVPLEDRVALIQEEIIERGIRERQRSILGDQGHFVLESTGPIWHHSLVCDILGIREAVR